MRVRLFIHASPNFFGQDTACDFMPASIEMHVLPVIEVPPPIIEWWYGAQLRQ